MDLLEELAFRADVEALRARGAELRTRWDGLSLLHVAAAIGSADLARLALEAGVPVDATAWPDSPQLQGMVDRSKSGSDPTRPATTPEWPATRHPAWRRIDRHGRRRFSGYLGLGAQGLRPLHLAIDCGHTELVQLLLADGADPTAPVHLENGLEGYYEWSPLDLAEERTDLRALLERAVVLGMYGHPEPSPDGRERHLPM